MSKRYMDFVPAKNADKRSAVVVGAPRRVNVVGTTKTTSTRTVTTSGPKVVMPETTATPRTRMARRDVSRRMVTQDDGARRVARRGAAQRGMAQGAMAQGGVGQGTMMQRSTAQSGVTHGSLVQGAGDQKVVVQRTMTTQRTTSVQKTAGGFGIRSDVKLGEIEDLSPKFVKMDVPKRPLGDGLEHKNVVQSTAENEVKEAKSRKLIGRFRGKTAKANAKAGAGTNVKGSAKTVSGKGKESVDKAGTFVTPRPAFINQDKVAKRPLSKNTYPKKITATDEQVGAGPVAIIAKPERESKAGLVVAIILTIILGAVAGTIAFLLLPK
ncbi:hypothetical protein IJG22_02005 [Candidatus Saccharibacteria bacterium]|nr:hypothetical protein [Candidatus Saccharibacteria bacterium]